MPSAVVNRPLTDPPAGGQGPELSPGRNPVNGRAVLRPTHPRPWSHRRSRRFGPGGFDLTVPWRYGDREDFAKSHAILLDIAPAKWGDTTSYAIRTLFLYRDSTIAKGLPYALCRVYATREGGNWVLANSLDQLTRDWRRTRYPPITFVYPMTHRFDAARARRSANL